MEEKRETITLVVGHGNASSMFYENASLKYVRVFPACREPHGESHALNPEELNQAVQMWINKKYSQEKSCNNCGKACTEHGGQRIIPCDNWQPENSLEKRVEMLESRQHHDFTTITALEQKVKALEDQHRETGPDPEKFICIDLGYPWKKIYVLKEETAKKPGEE